MNETAPSIAALRTRSLTKRFGATYALAGIDLELPTGTSTVVVGDAGSGKTTLLNLVLGKLRHTAGRIEVLGLDPLRDATPLRARIGHVPDHPDLPRWMTLRELCEACRASRRPWDERRAAALIAAHDLPERVRLGALRDDLALLSMLVVAAASTPELLLLDDAFDHLSDTALDTAIAIVTDAAADARCTVLATTAHRDIALRLADRVVTLTAGHAVHTTLTARPVTARAALATTA